MNNAFTPWFLVGMGVACLNHATRLWSVKHIHPGKKHQGKFLILGGALLRLLIVGISFFNALQTDIVSVLSVFAGLWIMRWMLIITSGLHITGRFKGHKVTRS